MSVQFRQGTILYLKSKKNLLFYLIKIMCFFFKAIFFRGALTSKPYAFLARPWEFRSVDSIDVFDSLASNIRVDVRGDKILRILPRSNELVNDDWISDKIRFICDAIRMQRLDVPVLKFNNSFFSLNWNQLFGFWVFSSVYWESYFNTGFMKHVGIGYSRYINPLLVLGLYLDLESSYTLSRITSSFFFNINSPSEVLANCNLLTRSNFLLNNSLSNLSSFDSIFLIDCNLKIESPVLFIYFRNLAKSGIKFYSFGKSSLSSYSFVSHVGSLFNFFDLIKGKNWLSNRLLKMKAFFLFDEKIFTSTLVNSFLTRLNIKFGVFVNSLAKLNSNENLLKQNSKFDRFCSTNQFLTNGSVTSSLNFSKAVSFNKQGTPGVGLFSHGNYLANSLDLLIPISSSFEQSKNYLNVLGLVQKTRFVLASPSGVLDSLDVLNFYYLSLLCLKLKSLSVFDKGLFFFHFFCFFNSTSLSDNKVWDYINFFFQLVESDNLSVSRLVSQFYMLQVDFKKLKTNELNFNFFKNNFTMPKKIFNSGLSGVKLESNLNFYQGDDVSLISSTLAAAGKRLIDKRAFF